MQTAACALRGSPSGGPVRSSASVDAAAGLAAPASGFTSPFGACLRGRSILKVMAVEVQYSSNPYKYLAEERGGGERMFNTPGAGKNRNKLTEQTANCKLDATGKQILGSEELWRQHPATYLR